MSKPQHEGMPAAVATITPAVVAKAARLARIALPEADLPALADQLERVRAWADTLQSVDVDHVAPMVHPHEQPMRLRDDADTGQTLTPSEVLANAPAQTDDHFLVPRVVG